MEKACAAAGTIIELGSIMFSSEGVGILTRVSSLLPRVPTKGICFIFLAAICYPKGNNM